MASNDLTLKLVIRGPAAASKTQGLVVQLTIDNNSGRTVSGTVQFALKDVISNDFVKPKEDGPSITVPSSGYTGQFTLGEFFNTPKTGIR